VVSNVIHFCNYLDYEMALSERRAAKKVPFMNHQEARRHLNMADRPAYMELPVTHWLEAGGSFDHECGRHRSWTSLPLASDASVLGGASEADTLFLQSVTVEVRDCQPVRTLLLDYSFYLQCTNFSSR